VIPRLSTATLDRITSDRSPLASIFFSKIEQSERFLKYFCIAIVLLLSAVHLLVQISLFADGSAFLVALLTDQTFIWPDPTRNFATTITQFPVVLLLKLGLKNINLLIYAQTFGFLLFPTIMWVVSLVVLRSEPLFWPFVILMSVVYLKTSFFAVGESHVAYSITACCMAILLSRRTISLQRGIILFALSFLVTRTYEALFFLGPLLSLMTGARLRDTSNQRLVIFLLWGAIILFLASSAIAASSILKPVAPDSFAEALRVSIIYRDRQLLLSFALSLIYLVYVVLGNWKETNRVCTIAAAATLFLLALPVNWALPRYYYDCRTMVALWLFGFGTTGLLMRVLPEKLGGMFASLSAFPIVVTSLNRVRMLMSARVTDNGMFIYLPILLMVFLATIDIYHSVQFRGFIENFAAEVDSRTGIVALEATNILERGGKYYGWGWTYPTTSLLLRADESKAVILNAKGHHGLQPPEAALPDLRSYYKDGRL